MNKYHKTIRYIPDYETGIVAPYYVVNSIDEQGQVVSTSALPASKKSKVIGLVAIQNPKSASSKQEAKTKKANSDSTKQVLEFTLNNNDYVKINNPSLITHYRTLNRNTQKINIKLNNRTYTTNSLQTLYGRDKSSSKEAIGQFKAIYTLTNEEILKILGYSRYIFEVKFGSRIAEQVVKQQSIGGDLDFKNTLYSSTLLNLDRETLIEVDGITYNPNEVGNYLWGMVLDYKGIFVSPNLIAELGTKGRHDEPWEQRAISNGIKKSNSIPDNDATIDKIFDYISDFIP